MKLCVFPEKHVFPCRIITQMKNTVILQRTNISHHAKIFHLIRENCKFYFKVGVQKLESGLINYIAF